MLLHIVTECDMIFAIFLDFWKRQKNILNAILNATVKTCFAISDQKGIRSKNRMLTFLFWVPKTPKKRLKIFLHLYKFMDYNETWFFMKKPRKKYRVFYSVNLGQKRQF